MNWLKHFAIVACLVGIGFAGSAFAATYSVTEANAGALAGQPLIWVCPQCSATAVPTVSNCGTSPTLSAAAKDMAGTVTLGSGATGCTLNLSGSYSSAPDVAFYSPGGLAFTTAAPASSGAATTFDPAHLGSQNTLSGGNLIASSGTAANGYYYARTTTSHSSGKYYLEFAISESGTSSVTFGLINASEVLGAINPGYSTNSVAGYSNGTNVVINGATIGTTPSLVNGHTAGVAVDLSAALIWFRDTASPTTWNAGGSANPATGTGGISLSTLSAGPYFAAAGVYSVSGNSATANFGATGYAATAPSGFGNW